MSEPISLEAFGFTKEELQQRIVDQCVEQVMRSVGMDDEGAAHSYQSSISQKIQAKAKKQIDDALNEFTAKFLTPSISTYLETLSLQPTSIYGEKKGQPQTFLEYLTQRSQEWLSEKVNEKGESYKDNSYSWKEHSTRGAWLIDSHLKARITEMLVGGITQTHQALAKSMEAEVKAAFQKVFSTLSVTTVTKVKEEKL